MIDNNQIAILFIEDNPGDARLIEELFKGENLYRMLSGMTHSTYTTLTSLAFTKTDFEREKENFV